MGELLWAWGGFLPFRGSFMLDLVVLAMIAVVPLLSFSLYLVRYRHAYTAHRAIQVGLAAVLGIAVAIFEIDMRFVTDWRKLAQPSPYYANGLLWWVLYIHLALAVPTLLIWIGLLIGAWRHFPSPPAPSPHSARHRWWGKIGSLGMFGTAITGWIFYYVAFIAS